MNSAAVPTSPYPPRPAILFGVLNIVAAVGAVVLLLTAPFRAVGRALAAALGMLATLPFARRSRRLSREHPSSVSYFGTAA